MNRADILTSEVVYLMPRPVGEDLNNKDHFTYFMIDKTQAVWVLPKDRSGRYIEILNGEEREFFEKELRVDDLSFTKRDKNGSYYNEFWANFHVGVIKDSSLMQNGRRFNMSDPIDNLSVRVLKTYSKWPMREICPAKEELKSYPECRWYLTTEAAEETSYLSKSKKKAEAYTHFGKISGSISKMIDFIRLYGATRRLAEQLDPVNTNPEYLTKKLLKILDEDLDGYLEVANDTNSIARLFIEDAVACGAIIKKDGEYRLKGGDALDPVDPTIEGTINWYITTKDNPNSVFTNIYSKVEKHRNKIVK